MAQGLTSEPALIRASQAGDIRATEALLASYEGYIITLSRDWFVPNWDYEDVRQECRLAFATAIKTWKPETTTPLKDWAKVLIRRRMLSVLVKPSRPCNQAELVPLQDWDASATERGYEAAETRALWGETRGRCSPLERAVVEHYADGYSYRETAARLGCSAKTVDNALTRVRARFEGQREDWTCR